MRKSHKLLSFILSLCIVSCIFSITCLAASGSATIACNTSLKKGESITVTVTFKAHSSDPKIWSAEGILSYNTSVLKFVESNTVANEKSSGNITFSAAGTGNSSTLHATFKFTAIANGKSTVSLSEAYYGGDIDNSLYSVGGQAVNITVADPPASSTKPPSSTNNTSSQTVAVSKNANLSALSVSGGTLSPAFSKNVTEYTVSVDNAVMKTTITATPAHKSAVVLGAGDIDLAVGDNKVAVSVTAPDGKTKKTYNINIRRATLEESLTLNPTATIIGGKLHYIVKDLSAMAVPAGFTLQNVSYNGIDINVFKSESADYTLFYITDAETATSDYYVYKELRDEFVPLSYITINNNIIILSELPEEYAVPEGYYETAVTLGGKEVRAFCSNDERLSDFYIIYCYANGAEQFCRYDMSESTLQRAPDFSLKEADKTDDTTSSSLLDKFFALDSFTKILVYVILIETVILIVLFILVLVVGRKRREQDDDDYTDAIIDDSDMSEFYERVAAPRHSAEDDE